MDGVCGGVWCGSRVRIGNWELGITNWGDCLNYDFCDRLDFLDWIGVKKIIDNLFVFTKIMYLTCISTNRNKLWDE